jgi:hypothetical protein
MTTASSLYIYVYFMMLMVMYIYQSNFWVRLSEAKQK